MKLYLDTSLIVSLLTMEAASARARDWVADRRGSGFVISWWVETEIASALSKKVRENRIGPIDRDRGMAAFSMFIASSAAMLPVAREHFSKAKEHCLREATGLRSADALHLAIAAAHDAALCTLDKRLAKAGVELGLATELV